MPPELATGMSRFRRLIVVAVTAMLAMAVYFLLPGDVNEMARRTAAIFIVAAVFWATEVLPVYATALCIVAMLTLFLAHDGGLAGALSSRSAWPVAADGQPLRFSAGTFFSPLGSPIIILFLGGFLLAAAIVKQGLDRAIAQRLLAPAVGRPFLLILALAGVTALLSMWMSNTAAAALMLSIAAPLMPADPRDCRGAAMTLAVAFGANLGGIATPIGTPPNAIAIGMLRDAGQPIRFLDWMLVSLPLALGVLVMASAVLFLIFRPAAAPLHASGASAAPALIPDVAPRSASVSPRAQRMSREARLTLIVMLTAIALWLTEPLHGLLPSVVALLAAAALTALGLLGRKDIDNIDWNVLVLMWGGLALGHAVQVSGLVDLVHRLPIEALSPWAVTALVALVTATVGAMMSNTATANLMVPIAAALVPQRSTEMVLVVAYACSLTMPLPVSTPPNAMAFATGRVAAPQMLLAGGLVTVLGLLILLAGHAFVLPWMLR